jgi:non-specific serine/threonine protein kinase
VLPYEGVRLFVERAKLVRPDFDVTTENASAIASICARLDGMPLAIELAAPRLRSMSVDELSGRLDQRFALLTDGSRTALPRHRTLRSMLDWSYDLLTEREQAVLRRVSVFVGGWSLASAEQVCAGDGIDASDVIEQLTSLVDKSLVVTTSRRARTRYRMLETVRQYALDRLRDSGEEAQWRGSHLACFVALAEEFFEGVEDRNSSHGSPDRERARQPAGRARMVGRIEPDRGIATRERVDASLAHSRPPGRRARLACPAPRCRPDRPPDARACTRPVRCRHVGDTAGRLCRREATATGEPGALPRDRRSDGAARALGGLACLSIEQGHYPEAEALARESVDCARATGDRRLLYSSLGHLAIALHRQGQWAAARELYEQALAWRASSETPWEIGSALRKSGGGMR